MADGDRLVLVKHAMPVLDGAVPPKLWRLATEGESQAKSLASRLERFAPVRVVASAEPKARRTGEILATELGLEANVVDGLEELDRSASPLVGADEHRKRNSAVFEDRSRAIVGTESADDALARFRAAVERVVAEADGSLVVVTHGTVIALFVAATDPQIDAFDLWSQLEAPSFVVLRKPDFELVEVAASPLTPGGPDA